MKIFFNIILISSVLLFVSSCSYNFSEDYYNDIDQIDPSASILLSDFKAKLVLTTPINVSYSYDGNNRHRLFTIKFYVDDIQIKHTSESAGDFYLDADALASGNHILKVEYIFSSGTGSIADVNNLEAYIKTDEYNFSIDKSAPTAITLKKVEIVKGSIYVTWTPISNINFEEAVLIIKSEGNIIDEISLTNEVLNSQVYNDKNSLCINLNYSIRLKNRYNQSISNDITLNIEPITIEKEIINEHQFKLKWSKHPLYNNFGYYDSNISNPYLKNLSTKGGEGIVDKVPVFGNMAPFNYYNVVHFYFKPFVNNNSFKKCGDISREVFFGKKFENNYAKEYLYAQNTNSYYAIELAKTNQTTGFSIHQLNADNLSLIKSVHIGVGTGLVYSDFIVDPHSNSFIIDLSTESYLVDLTTFSIKKQWSSKDFGITKTYIRTHYRNNIIFIENLRTKEISIFDAETRAQLYKAPRNYYFKVSDNGQYFYNNDGIYEIKNKAISLITSTDTGSSIHSIDFMSNLNKCIYSSSNKNPVIFDFNSKTKTVINAINSINDVQYDKITKRVLLGQYHGFYNGHHKSFVNIYDLNDNSSKRLEVYDDHGGNFYRYLNGKLIFSRGLYLDHYIN